MRHSSRRANHAKAASSLSRAFAAIYYRCHPTFTLALSHQAVRALQFVSEHDGPNVQALAVHLGCAQNTASEITKRLIERGLVEKRRRLDDERSVELALTREGEGAMREQTGLDEAKLRRCLATMTDVERERVESAFAILRDRLGELGEP